MGALKASIFTLAGLAVLGGGALALREGGWPVGTPPPVEVAQPVPDAMPLVTAPASQSAPEPPRPDAAPSLDIVRLDPDGTAVIGGTGLPGAPVEILVDGAAVWSGAADDRGDFVAFVELPASAVARTLWLRSGDGKGGRVASAASVVLAPTPEIAAADDTLAPTRAGSGAADATGATGANAAAADATGSVALLQSGPQGVRPLEPAPLDPDQSLALDTVRYGADGEVILAGRSDAEARDLSIYLDGEVAARARISGQGNWQAVLSDVPTGVYRLRADLRDRAGRVAGRVDLPFRREAPEVIEAARVAADAADQSAALLTVQPGYSLWAIARDRYDDGFQYVAVYEANAEAIEDPDLIYPGQVLTLPVVVPNEVE